MTKPFLLAKSHNLQESPSFPGSIDEQLVEVEAGLRSLDERGSESAARQAESTRLCEAREQELDRIRSELDALRYQLDDERRQLEALREDWNVRRAAEAEPSAACETELQAERQSFEAQKAAWESQKTAAQNLLDDRAAGLDALQVDLRSQRAAIEKHEKNVAREKQPGANETTRADAVQSGKIARSGAAGADVIATSELIAPTREPEPAEAQAGLNGTCDRDKPLSKATVAKTQEMSAEIAGHATDAATKPAPTKSEPSSKAAPVDLAEILRRTGFQLDDADQPAEKAKSNTKIDGKNKNLVGAAAANEPSGVATANITSPVARTRKPVEPREEEVSIDDYMARLLARNRGDAPLAAPPTSASRPAPSPARAPAVPQPSAPANAPAARSPAAAAAPVPQENLVEMSRRSAPELSMDLKAMRHLANLSANTAISKHESKQLTGTTRTKLVITIVSGLAGCVLLGFHAAGGAPRGILAAAIASFAVAALWGTNYLLLCKRMMRVRMAHMERHLKAGEDASAAVTVDAPSSEPAETPLELAEKP